MFYSLYVLNVKKETSNSVSIEFEIPQTLSSEFSFKAGQFVTVRKQINNEEIRRSYSICSTPESGKIKLVVKQIPNGKFSTYAVQELKIGDIIDVTKPSGDFFLNPQPKNEKSYTLIAAGSGITPIISILKTILIQEPNSTVNLFYGNKSPELTIFKKEIETLNQKYSEKLNVHFIYSQTKGKSRFHNGRLEGRKIKKIFKKLAPVNLTDNVFICGPQDMTTTIKNLLENTLNFDASCIHYELFISNKVDKKQKSKNKKGSSIATAILNGETFEFVIKKNESILEAGLAAGYDIPFSCQGGVCGVCKCLIGEGEIEMENNIALSDDEVESGTALSCQAKVLSPIIIIDFDN
tara:strand:+ start:1614 stop:2666 length:1053 start_codon:yes stop_codon:yes gene_type:complete